jgi:2-succinyl-6-hydroxy-2,4-cyclohexadiene-1-carboxylate synthase
MSLVNVLGVPHACELRPSPAMPHAGSAVSKTSIVFIHGWLLSRLYWQPLMAQLSSEYTCLAYDLRGFGQSTEALEHRVGNSSYGLEAYAEDLIALLKALGLERVWVVGHSLGGSVALWAAHLAPEQIQGVICVNAGGGIYIDQAFAQFRSAGKQMVRWRARWLQHMPLLAQAFSRMMVTQPLGLDWGRQRLVDFLRADPVAALGALEESTTQAEVNRLPHLVAQLRQPAYFITGAQDTVMAPRYVRHLASFHPLFQAGENNVITLERCGHFAMLEQTDEVAAVVREMAGKGS